MSNHRHVGLHRLTGLAGDKRGSILVPLALTTSVLVAAVGVAVDYSIASSARAELQAATDAALTAARASPGTLSNVEKVGTAAFFANQKVSGASITITQPGPGVTQATASRVVPTSFMKIAGINEIKVNAFAEVSGLNIGAIEVALVLDTTGSMQNDMVALKTAAAGAVESMFTSAAGNPDFRMSVVPFVAAVNPGRAVLEKNSGAMVDVAGSSYWHSRAFKGQPVAMHKGCIPNWGPGSGGGTGKGGTGAQLFDPLKPLGHFALETLGIKEAKALGLNVTPNTLLPLTGLNNGPSGQFVPAGFDSSSRYAPYSGGCDWLYNPNVINHFDLFNRIPNKTAKNTNFNGWKGCVEARPTKSDGATQDYDVTDAPPVASDPHSLFVPYFWPDEPDMVDANSVAYNNNWLPDGTLLNGTVDPDPTGKGHWQFDTNATARTVSILKYNGVNKGDIVEAAPNTSGPNKACPDEVLPLTNVKSNVLNKINSLSHWNGGGTIISEGLMWGWRTLSPNLPFADGKPYDPTVRKVIVLMSDGKNELGENGRDKSGNIEGSPMASDYNAYGYLRAGRFPAQNFQSAYNYLDNRLKEACNNARAKGITIYTVIFKENDPQANALMKNCATKPENAFKSTNGADLAEVFAQISAGISQLRLTK